MRHPNNEYIQELLRLVNKSPFPAHIAMKLTSIDMDHATLELCLSDRHLQLYGIVHGGVLATLVDTATFWAVFMRQPENAGLVNVDIKLNYLKSVASGTLFAEGRCIRSGRALSYAEAIIKDEKGDLITHGTSTLMALPGKGLRLTAKKFLS
ncbi:MAG: PaaI family thioesterase [Pseudomonadota bacterium]